MNKSLVYKNERFEVYESDIDSIYLKELEPECSSVVALHNNKLVVVKQYRAPVDEYTYELPGGGLELGEDKEDAARRELLEEAGLSCGELIFLGTIQSHGCMLNRVTHLFFTRDIRSIHKQDLDFDEDIEVLTFPLEEAFEHIKNGAWKDTELAHGLLLAKLKELV